MQFRTMYDIARGMAAEGAGCGTSVEALGREQWWLGYSEPAAAVAAWLCIDAGAAGDGAVRSG